MRSSGDGHGFACQQFVPAFAGALTTNKRTNHSNLKRKRSIMPRRHDVAQRGHNASASSPTFLASAPDCFCVWYQHRRPPNGGR